MRTFFRADNIHCAPGWAVARDDLSPQLCQRREAMTMRGKVTARKEQVNRKKPPTLPGHSPVAPKPLCRNVERHLVIFPDRPKPAFVALSISDERGRCCPLKWRSPR